jgi:YidC/Oxa1 family membrane protein insertase
MDKRVFVAAGISVLILVAWSYFFPPPKPPERPVGPDPTVTEPAPETARPEPAPLDPVADEPAYEEPAAVQAAAAREIAIDNGIFRVTLSNRGGIATAWSLSDKTTGDEPLELLPPAGDGQARMLGVEVDDSGLSAAMNEALYQVDHQKTSDGDRVSFTWADGRGFSVRKELEFRRDDYLVDVNVEATDRGRPLEARLLLGPGFGEQGLEKKGTYYYESVVWNVGGEVSHTKKSKFEGERGGLDGSVRWAGLEDQYFAAIVVPGGTDNRIDWRTVEMASTIEQGETEHFPILAVSVPSDGAKLYFGPKKYRLLESLGGELEKSVWFSSFDLLAWIARGIFFGLLWIHDNTIANYGLAIVACTFLLRVLLFPVNQYSMVSMKKTQLQMQRLQPKIKSIKNKYKKQKDAESRGKMNQEMMDLYKREGVNPMGGVSGCLPLLAQIPILMAFYFMLTVAVELRGAPFFGWIKDLSVADPFYVTPLLMGVTMFIQQKLAMSKVKDPVQQQQQKFMMIMPFVFTWICIQMPAGMVLYWFVNNVLGIGQQWLVNRHTTRLEAAAAQKA